MTKVVTLLSGGLDSSTLAYHLAYGLDCSQVGLFIDYGQRHLDSELLAAKWICTRLGVALKIVGISGVFQRTNALTGDLEVPDAPYSKKSLAQTVVPNRNAVFANCAAAYAAGIGYDAIALAVHTGDHEVYADCRPLFVSALRTLFLAQDLDIEIFTPFLHSTKAEIVEIGSKLGVPFELTWSCYKGGRVHCGTCSTCIERKQAFLTVDVLDPTVYLSPSTEYQTALRQLGDETERRRLYQQEWTNETLLKA